MAELISYEITIKGRIPAQSRAAAVEYIRAHTTFNFPMHESIDEFLIETTGESFEDFKQRFPG